MRQQPSATGTVLPTRVKLPRCLAAIGQADFSCCGTVQTDLRDKWKTWQQKGLVGFRTGSNGMLFEKVWSMFRNQGVGTLAYLRLIAVLRLLYEYLCNGKRAPQRNVYYR